MQRPSPALPWAFALVLLLAPLALPACSGDGGGDDDPAKEADAKGSALKPAPFSLRGADATIDNGGSFHIPGNDVGEKVAPWKRVREAFTIDNGSDSAVTVQRIEVRPSEANPSEAFTVEDADGNALDVKDTPIAPGAKMTFYVGFRPVASGPHAATIAVTYDSGEVFELNVTGTGAAGLDLWPLPQPDLARLLGSPKADEMASAMVVDDKGGAWISANVRGLADKDNYDVLLAHMTPDGGLGWARVLNGAYRDLSPDDGGNSETGGTAGSLSLAGGDVYLCGATSTTKVNARFKALVVRLSGGTGETVWAKVYEPNAGKKGLSNSALAYALDATGEAVLVTGKTKGGVLLLALAPKDGALLYARALAVVPGAGEIGHAITSDGKGGAWIGGQSDGRPFVAHLLKVGDEPEIGWAGIVDAGSETRVSAIALGGSGDAFVAISQGGAETTVAAARLGQDGKLGWAARLVGLQGGLARAHAIAVAGGSVWVAGRVGLAAFDDTRGDGLLLELGAEDGALRKAAVHWAGPEASREVEHRVKAVAITAGGLFLAEQAFTGPDNKRRYRGYWYKGDLTAEAFSPDVTTKADATLTSQDKAALGGADNQVLIEAAPDALVLLPSKGKADGEAPDADVLISRLTLP